MISHRTDLISIILPESLFSSVLIGFGMTSAPACLMTFTELQKNWDAQLVTQIVINSFADLRGYNDKFDNTSQLNVKAMYTVDVLPGQNNQNKRVLFI